MANEKILIAEDEVLVAMDMERTLHGLGYRVVAVVDTGLEAVQEAQRTQPDLVLMDIRLKGEMDGIEAARQIYDRLRIPILYLTAYSDEKTVQRAKATGAVAYLLKPFEERELRTAIEIGLHRHRAEEEFRQKSDQALRQSEERFRLLVEGVKEYAIFMLDPSGLVVSWNNGAENILGYSAEEILGKHVSVFYTIPDNAKGQPDQALRVAETEGRYREQGVRVRKDGGVFCADVVMTPMRENGKLQGFAKITQDITQQKESERTLQKAKEELEQCVHERTAQLQESIGELEAFSYSLSHDLRAPLRAMRSFSEMLVADYGDKLDEQGKDYLQRITSAAGRLDRLIHDVLDYSRVSRAEIKLKAIDVQELVCQLTAENPHLQPPHAQIKIEGPLIPLRGDEASLTQCISNFLSNATKFVPKGRKPEITIRSEAADSQVRLWFEDNGIGIPEEARDDIFGMFQRVHRNYEGTGLGLAIVRKAVERMGGTVGFESKPGEGSRFWLQLPRGKAS